MKTLVFTLIQKLRRDNRGQDLVEYALLAGFVAVAGGVFFPTTVMPGVSTIFSKLADYFIKAAAQG